MMFTELEGSNKETSPDRINLAPNLKQPLYSIQ
jgi:hypothetical protein